MFIRLFIYLNVKTPFFDRLGLTKARLCNLFICYIDWKVLYFYFIIISLQFCGKMIKIIKIAFFFLIFKKLTNYID